MLNYFLCLILCMIITTCSCKDFFLHDYNLQAFLSEKFLDVNRDLNIDIKEHSIKRKDIHEHLEVLSYETSLIGKVESLHLLKLFNKSYINNGSSLNEIIPSEIHFVLNEIQNFTAINHEVDFIRTIYYDNNEFIASCLRDGISNIYLATNIYEVRLKQFIQNRGRVVDSKFFINNGELYLITASNLGTSLSITSLYKWYGTYFDRIAEVLSENINSIYTFSDGNTEIIVILQNATRSLIYSMNYDQLELIYVDDYPTSIGIEKIHPSNDNSVPMLFTGTRKEIVVYNPISFNLLANYTLEDQFLKIYEMNTITINRGDKFFFYFLAQLENGTAVMNSMQFVLHSTQTEDKIRENVLNECLTDLKSVLQRDGKLLSNMIESDYGANMPLRENATEHEIDNSNPAVQESIFNLDISNKLNEIAEILDEIQPNVTDLFRTDVGIFDGRVTVAGSLTATTLKGDNINLEKLNSKKWSPQHWLSYNIPQTITGYTKGKHFVIQNITMPTDTIFKDVLLLNGNQQFEGRITFKTLHSTDVYFNRINGINLEDLYVKGDRRIVKGIKRFDLFKCVNLSLSTLNQRDAFDYLKRFTTTQHRHYNNSEVAIKDLQVENINSIHWSTFAKSLFRNGSSNKITGRLTIKKLRVGNIKAIAINDINPNNMLTASTNQNITSKIYVNSIRANDFSCPDINGVNMATDVIALFDTEKTIAGPVTFDNLLILKDLHLNYTESKTARNNIVQNKRHEMQQIYKKVKIIGNVSIDNLIFQSNSTLHVNGNEFNMASDIKTKYWLKRTPQEIAEPVTIQKLVVPDLKTKFLNGFDLSEYMLNDLGDKPPTRFAFDNLTVLGNIITDSDEEHSPNLTKINVNAVKLTGSYDIAGRKIFKNNLTVNAAKIHVLDDVDTTDALHIHKRKMSGKKEFESLIIKGDLNVVETSYMHHINGVALNSIYQRFLSTDHKTEMESLKMKSVTADILTTTTLNNQNLNKFILNLDDLHSIGELTQVEINGNITAENIQNLTLLNGINFNIIRKKIAGDPVMTGNTKYLGDVYIKNLKVSNINNIPMPELTSNLLYKHLRNHIKAKQYFRKLRTPSLICDYINNIDTRDFVDVNARKSQSVILRHPLRLEGTRFLTSLRGNLPCDIHKLVKCIRNPPTRYWSSIKILKNTTIEDPLHVLSQILKNSVTIGGRNNITAPVTFSRVTAKHVYTNKQINNVDVEEIYNDALLRSNNDELINSTKVFKRLTAAGVAVNGNVNVTTVNKLLMKRIDESIISKDEIRRNVAIKGRKIFNSGLKTDVLYVKTITNLDPNNLVSTDKLRPIPYASFDNLHILHNFDVHQINQINFTPFLEGRLLKSSPSKQILTGIYYFDNVTLNGESKTSSINDIDPNDLVYDTGLQIIPVSKEFSENLTIYGNVTIDSVNGVNLAERYENAIFIDQDDIDVENIVFDETARIRNISTRNLNGIPIESVKAILQSETLKIKANIAHDTIDKIRDVLEANLKIAEHLPSQYMYLDKYYDLEISIPNAVQAELIQVNGHAMIHVLSEEPAYTCELSPYCKCLVQNTIQFTPELSVHLFADKNNQRVYSYDDSLFTIHVTTDSVSYSTNCRKLNTSSSAEYTTITWISKLNGHSFVFSGDNINGYIADVDFFSFANYIYIILNKLYDIESEANESHCIILRFNKDTDQIEVIQKLQTTPFGIIHVHQMNYGSINLIIGNAFLYKRISTHTGTTMYRFDPEKQAFVILRKIHGIHCLSAKSIEIDRNHFLILAQKNKNIAIWKYDDVQKNYFFYQNFMLNSPATSVSPFYAEDGFILAVTQEGSFYVYGFRYIEGWKLLSQGEMEGLRLLTPFKQDGRTYLFAPISGISSLFILNEQGRD
ncbi:hypothetical protein QE152_g562 [Popillia japonica]|uniref:Uncharacterized protein n=1 Tax=Popillia japonica TaxID=7064 RepID=A0AAW1NJX9_POPJA